MAGKDRQANGSAPDDAEFEKLLDEMDELGRQADALRAKVNHLIDEMRENDVPAEEEAGEGADSGAVDEGHAAGGETHVTASDEETNGVAVNEGSAADDEGSVSDDEGSAAGADIDAAGKATGEDGEPEAT